MDQRASVTVNYNNQEFKFLVPLDKGSHINKQPDLYVGDFNKAKPENLKLFAEKIEDGVKLLNEIEKREITPINALQRAGIYAALGIKDEAFKWLAYEPHHSTVAWAAIIDDFEPLHGDPRWNEFLKRVNLPRK
jgi:hypothetical protein